MKYLTYDEKVLLVFNDINNRLTNNNESKITVDGGKNYSFVKTVPYSSFEEFTKENPNCCGIDRDRGREIPVSDFFDLIGGNGYNVDEIIAINYKNRYLDKNGKIAISAELKIGRVVTNCGRVTR